MIIAAIKTNGKEKLLALCKRYQDGQLSDSVMCDWNTVPNTLRIYWGETSEDITEHRFENFKQAIKFIFSF